MKLTMRLDTGALRELIKTNPEVNMELGQAVLNNLKDDFLVSKVQAKVLECLKSMAENKGSLWAPNWVAKCPELKAAVKAAADEVISDQIKEAVDKLLDSRIAELIAKETASLKLDLKTTLRELLTPEMAKELMREKLF